MRVGFGKAVKIRRRQPYRRTPVRCSKCEMRYTFSMHPDFYKRPRKCRCGSKKFYVDKWMLRRGTRQRCQCPAYWFPHRKGGGLCQTDPVKLEAFIARARPPSWREVQELVPDDAPQEEIPF